MVNISLKLCWVQDIMSYQYDKYNNITDYSHLITDKFRQTIKKIYQKDYELLGNYF